MVQNASQIKNLLFAINSNLFINFSGFQIFLKPYLFSPLKLPPLHFIIKAVLKAIL